MVNDPHTNVDPTLLPGMCLIYKQEVDFSYSLPL